MEGKETELDRTVIDEIGDPLLHLIRNALDHGLESPEERKKVGKPATGTLKLSARHEGNRVMIYVEDDGKGLNPDACLLYTSVYGMPKSAFKIGAVDYEVPLYKISEQIVQALRTK